ncbi:hypothetical protein HYZ97_03905 [Candidatus Pacearchaeota archaeon]|nr:hypothetical protein [Candidatus Pacearchaeota archaeon]
METETEVFDIYAIGIGLEQIILSVNSTQTKVQEGDRALVFDITQVRKNPHAYLQEQQRAYDAYHKHVRKSLHFLQERVAKTSSSEGELTNAAEGLPKEYT